jgi:hypothetical protein
MDYLFALCWNDLGIGIQRNSLFAYILGLSPPDTRAVEMIAPLNMRCEVMSGK